MWNIVIILLSRLALQFIRLRHRSGSTWPGHIALLLNKHFIKQILEKSAVKVILIAGTNGKTTTSTLITHILKNQRQRVFQNEEGANLLNGIASAIIKHCGVTGTLNYDYALFEVDENTLPLTLEQISPEAIILLNLFRDQLDRYGEVNTIAYKWLQSLKRLSADTTLIVNGDDPQLYYIGSQSTHRSLYFGLADRLMDKKSIPHDVDSVYCPVCKTKLSYHKMSFSHLGDFSCSHCGFKREHVQSFSLESTDTKLKGIYNYYNISAVLLLMDKVLKIPQKNILPSLNTFTPAFGRQEEIQYQGKKLLLILSKNPTGFNQSIETVKEIISPDDCLLIVINDRIPDGTDISWIWDVEFQNLLPLSKKIFLSGDRAFDIALRFHYSLDSNEAVKVIANHYLFDKFEIFPQLHEALVSALQSIPNNKQLIVLATYTAMLDVRQIVVQRKLL